MVVIPQPLEAALPWELLIDQTTRRWQERAPLLFQGHTHLSGDLWRSRGYCESQPGLVAHALRLDGGRWVAGLRFCALLTSADYTKHNLWWGRLADQGDTAMPERTRSRSPSLGRSTTPRVRDGLRQVRCGGLQYSPHLTEDKNYDLGKLDHWRRYGLSPYTVPAIR